MRGASCLRGPAGTAASSAPHDIYDVAVVGGGMVGAAFAALLEANPLTAALRVLLLDRAAPPEALGPLPPVPGLRVSTLTPASGRLLERAGAWRDVAPPYSAAFDTMQARSRASCACSWRLRNFCCCSAYCTLQRASLSRRK